MLVLSRKIGEAIIIGDRIRITIVEISNGRVKIGVDAPHDVKVDREEIHIKKQAEQPAILAHDPEAAIPVQMNLHNRIADALPISSEHTPAPVAAAKLIDFRRKSR